MCEEWQASLILAAATRVHINLQKSATIETSLNCIVKLEKVKSKQMRVNEYKFSRVARAVIDGRRGKNKQRRVIEKCE
jgi:hypothetical protein